MPAIIATAINANFGRSFLKLSPLNLRAIIGNVDTIKYAITAINAYQNQGFNNKLTANGRSEYQYIKGKEAINNPAAGMGTPLKPNDCSSSKLKRPSLYAPAHGIIKAGISHIADTFN